MPQLSTPSPRRTPAIWRISSHGRPTRSRLGGENWRRVAANAEVVGALYFELAAHAMHGRPYAAPIRAAVPQRVEAAFAAAYRAGNADVPAAALARLTVAVGHGLLFAMLLDGDRAASEAALDLFTSMVRDLDEASRTDAPPPS